MLRSRPTGSGAHALGARLGLHVNTVRSHLAVLEEAGLVESEPEQRGVPGRPRILYRAPDTVHDDAREGYRVLARVLADGLATGSSDPGGEAERLGERWGRQLGGPRRPGHRTTREEMVGRATELLEALGFAPRAVSGDPGAISMHRCPYREVAAEHPEIVCRIHLGVLRGALQDPATTSELTMTPFDTPTTCTFRIA